MAPTYKEMPHIIEQIRQAKVKSGYSDATMITAINDFSGRGWAANFLTGLLGAKLKPDADAIDVLEKYLLASFYTYNSS